MRLIEACLKKRELVKIKRICQHARIAQCFPLRKTLGLSALCCSAGIPYDQVLGRGDLCNAGIVEAVNTPQHEQRQCSKGGGNVAQIDLSRQSSQASQYKARKVSN